MAKLSQVDRAIAALEAERDVLDLAIAKLKTQQAAKPKAKASRRQTTRATTSASDNGE